MTCFVADVDDGNITGCQFFYISDSGIPTQTIFSTSQPPTCRNSGKIYRHFVSLIVLIAFHNKKRSPGFNAKKSKNQIFRK